MTAPQGPGWPGQPGPQGPYQPRPPHPQGQPYPQQQPYPYPPQQPPPAPPRPRRGRTALIVSLVVVLVAGLGIGGWALFGRGGGADSSQAGGGKGTERTEADVVKMDPKKLLDDMLTALLTQPVLNTRIESILLSQVAPYVAGQPYEGKVVEGGFDYRQRKMNYLDDTYACVDGAKRRVRYDGAIAEDGPCEKVKGVDLGAKVGDGLIPGGMNETQAQAFLAYLHKAEGFLNPGKPTVVPREGKQYVRFPVVFSALQTDVGQAGTQIFTWAFRQTKLSFDDHPYTAMGLNTGQTEAVYYLDPKTLLPAYSEQLIYDPKDDPTAAEGTARRVEYLWDGKLPTPDASQLGKPKGPSWPSERLKPGQLK